MKKKVMDKKDRAYYFICYLTIIFLTLLVLYPMVYIVSASFSSTEAVGAGRVWLWPVGFSLEAYKKVFEYKSIWIGYKNTIFYTVVGTTINIAITMLCAYPLSRRNLRGRKFLLKLFSFTMIFGGGMIPTYILIRKLGMLNSIWAVMIPGAMSVYNMIVARTFIENNISNDLLEAAKIDGCDDFKFFTRMVLPLSKTIMAVLCVWYAVGHWNAYFDAFLYINDAKLYPLQIFLREILVNNDIASDLLSAEEMLEQQRMTELRELIKYAIIVVASAPLLCVYPFANTLF